MSLCLMVTLILTNQCLSFADGSLVVGEGTEVGGLQFHFTFTVDLLKKILDLWG